MLELYQPELEDLWFREEFMSDADTMSYNHAQGGIIPFPREKWEEWYDRWLVYSQANRSIAVSPSCIVLSVPFAA